MKRLLFLPAIIWTTSCFSQRQNVYFLKNDGRYVNQRDSADFVRIVREPDSASVLYNVFEFYLNGKNKLIGKSSTIEPVRLEGQCLEFNSGGARKKMTNYKNGVKAGVEYVFYPSGKPYQVNEYPNSGDVMNQVTDNYLIKANYDSLGTVLVENGNGYYKGYDDNFKEVNEEGALKDGKKDGLWKGNFKNIKTSFIESYIDGKLITGTAINENGKTVIYTKSRGMAPLFKGGLDAFGRYLASHIHYPVEERDKHIQGRVILSFVVEKDGTIRDIKVSKSASPGLDNEAIRVIADSPHWIPATLFGSPVRVLYSVPISFALSYDN
jgi:TonB family protein